MLVYIVNVLFISVCIKMSNRGLRILLELREMLKKKLWNYTKILWFVLIHFNYNFSRGFRRYSTCSDHLSNSFRGISLNVTKIFQKLKVVVYVFEVNISRFVLWHIVSQNLQIIFNFHFNIPSTNATYINQY